MGLPLSNAYVKPHLEYTSIARSWSCATAVLNPFYRKDEPNRYMLVNPPVGWGYTPMDAYDNWAQRSVGY